MVYLLVRRVKRWLKRRNSKKELSVPTPPVVPQNPERYVKQTPNNPLGLEGFDMKDINMNVFNLEDNRPLTSPNDITGGLLERAENLRKELEANAETITKQLSDIRAMRKEVAQTALILKNYFQDLGKKEMLLQTTLNNMGVRRKIENGGQ